MTTFRDPRVELRCWRSVESETFLLQLGLKLPLCLGAGKEGSHLSGRRFWTLVGRMSMPSSWLPSGGPITEDVLSEQLRGHGGQLAGHLWSRAWGEGSPCTPDLCAVGVKCQGGGSKVLGPPPASLPQRLRPPCIVGRDALSHGRQEELRALGTG